MITKNGIPVDVRYALNVKEYGAKGNGIVDDYAAVSAATTALISLGGGMLFFPRGTYRISGTINISTDVNIIFEGEGKQSTIDYTGSGSCFTITGGTGTGDWVANRRVNFVFRDLKIATSTGANAFNLQNIHFCTFEQLRIEGFSDYAVLLKGGFFNSFRDISIYNCGHGYKLTSASWGYPPKANANRLEQGEIYLSAGANPIGINIDVGNGNLITGVCIEGNTKTGILINNGSYNIIDNPWIEIVVTPSSIGIEISSSLALYNNISCVINDAATPVLYSGGQRHNNVLINEAVQELILHGQTTGSADETFTNLATHSSFEDAHHCTTGGTNPPVATQEIADGHMDLFSTKLAFPAGIPYTNGYADSRFQIDTTDVAMVTGDRFLVSWSAKASEAVDMRVEWNGALELASEVYSFTTDWKRYYMAIPTYSGAGGNNRIIIHVAGAHATGFNLWIDDVQVVKNSSFSVGASVGKMGWGSRYFPYIPTIGSAVTIQSGEFIAALGKIITNEIQPAGGGTLVINGTTINLGGDVDLTRSGANILYTPDNVNVGGYIFCTSYFGPSGTGSLTVRDGAGAITWFVLNNSLDIVDFQTPIKDCVRTDATRTAATNFPAGSMIWNSNDNAPNWSDGTNWRDAVGNIT